LFDDAFNKKIKLFYIESKIAYALTGKAATFLNFRGAAEKVNPLL